MVASDVTAPFVFSRKITKKIPHLIWRMTEANPAGGFVCPSTPATTHGGVHESHARGLRESSRDLSDGAEVTETDISTLPGDLMDEFLKPEVL